MTNLFNNSSSKGNPHGTLYQLENLCVSKQDLLNRAIKDWKSEQYVLDRKVANGEAYKFQVNRWNPETKEEKLETVTVSAKERAESLKRFIASASAEVTRLSFAIRAIRAEASKEGVTGLETYELMPGYVRNTDKKYPSSSYKGLSNSASLLRAMTFEIRNVVLERQGASDFDKRKAGYLQRDARLLKERLEHNRRKLRRAAYKLGWTLLPQ